MENQIEKINGILNKFQQEIELLRQEILALKKEKGCQEDTEKIEQIRKNIGKL